MSARERLRSMSTAALLAAVRALTSLQSASGERLERDLRADGWEADELEQLKTIAESAVRGALLRQADGDDFCVAVSIRGLPRLRTARMPWSEAIATRGEILCGSSPPLVESVTILNLQTGEES